jgi:hypothetical protein
MLGLGLGVGLGVGLALGLGDDQCGHERSYVTGASIPRQATGAERGPATANEQPLDGSGRCAGALV